MKADLRPVKYDFRPVRVGKAGFRSERSDFGLGSRPRVLGQKSEKSVCILHFGSKSM